MKTLRFLLFAVFITFSQTFLAGHSQEPTSREVTLEDSLFQYFSSIPAIDTHDHLPPFDLLPSLRKTPEGIGVNLAGIWQNSYFNWLHSLPSWEPERPFLDWWQRAVPIFDLGRATSVYRYQLPAFRDLYGVDFGTLDEFDVIELNRRIFENYQDEKWLCEVITEKANIELMLNDPWWDYLGFSTYYPFEVLVFNVNSLIDGYHPGQFEEKPGRIMSPFQFAREKNLPLDNLDDYLNLIEELFRESLERGAVSLKTTAANRRTLQFERVDRTQVEAIFGRSQSELSQGEIKKFQDFIMWHIASLSARYQMPLQIHTGLGELEGSSPLELLNLIEGNPKTRFILFHGGFPWVRESGALTMSMLIKNHGNVWLNSVWLPILSYSLARRTFDEWLDMLPSDRILWGADCNHAEGIYGSVTTTRRCLAEVLAKKIRRGELSRQQAERIGRRILRENALELFPRLEQRLWKKARH